MNTEKKGSALFLGEANKRLAKNNNSKKVAEVHYTDLEKLTFYNTTKFIQISMRWIETIGCAH